MTDLSPHQKESADPFFEMDEADLQHPFTMVPNELIRNENLSPNCIWLIIYLLSNVSTWKIRVSQILNHVRPHIGRDKLYKLLDEACTEGYIAKIKTKVGNLDRIVYKLSRTAKFKKMFPNTGFQDPELQDPENTDHKNTIYKKNKEKKDVSLSPAATGLTTFFFEKLKEINPKIRPPDKQKWSQEIDHLLKTDGRTEKEIKDVIEFIVYQHTHSAKEFTWSKAVASPSKLRQHFAQIWLDMTSKPPGKVTVTVEEDLTDEIFKRREFIGQLSSKNQEARKKKIYIEDQVTFSRIGNDRIDYKDIKFYEKLNHLIRKYQLKN